jgi:hypothetical protein
LDRSEHAQSLAASLVAIAMLVLLPPLPLSAAEPGFTQYTDPGRRFMFDYPSTMKVQVSNSDEVKIFHPGATLRITVFVEKRPRATKATARDLLAAFNKKLKEEMKDVSIIQEGKLENLGGSQGYVICSFKNRKGIHLVQLVQYYVTKDRLLQMTISDLPRGFKNLWKVIDNIHRSLRIINPDLTPVTREEPPRGHRGRKEGKAQR